MLKFGGAATVGIVSGVWLNLGPILQALLVFMAVDILTGFMAAYTEKILDSRVTFLGMTKKASILLLVLAGSYLEPLAGFTSIDEAISAFYLAYEGLSIFENAARLGLPVPQQLRDALARVTPRDDAT